METEPGAPRILAIWAVTDGRAGNVAQALGLAEAVARRVPARVERRDVALRPGAAVLPARVLDWAGRHLPGWPGAALAGGMPEGLPDLAIGAGRRAAPVVAALGRAGARTVQLLDPRMDPAAFGLVAAPAHDGLRAPNAVATLGSVGRVTPGRIAAEAGAAEALVAPLAPPRLAVLLGGPSGSARWGREDGARLAAALARAAAAGWSLAVTPSRRTDPAVAAAIRAAVPEARLRVWDGTGANPYPGLLAAAEAVVVTEDSVNMASEAAASGLPVHVFRLARTAPKIRAFHADLAARGIARDFDGTVGRWTYPPLAEADRVAEIAVARLALAP